MSQANRFWRLGKAGGIRESQTRRKQEPVVEKNVEVAVCWVVELKGAKIDHDQ